MKKLIAILGAVGLTATGSASLLVSCSTPVEKDFSSEIGKMVKDYIKIDQGTIYEDSNEIYTKLKSFNKEMESEILKLKNVDGVSKFNEKEGTFSDPDSSIKPSSADAVWFHSVYTSSSVSEFSNNNDFNKWTITIQYRTPATNKTTGELYWGKYNKTYINDIEFFKAKKPNAILKNSDGTEQSKNSFTLVDNQVKIRVDKGDNRENIILNGNEKITDINISLDTQLFEEPEIKLGNDKFPTYFDLTLKLKQGQTLSVDQKIFIKLPAFQDIELIIEA
ncbi:lipoprotein [Mesoplasma florum]|uniref:lipoprotein n=1 Tax=Mesoplasma florum TaxID=2151 RepID=UPI000BE38725|nr:lipoprotein [Mesoplasma florum]ATI73669.1 hypothetical protein CQZ70_00115 [Mesoplasma florum]